MHQIRDSIAFHYKFYGNQRRLYDIPKTAHTVRHNPWTAEDNDNGFWSSVQPTWGVSVVTLVLVIALHWHSRRCPAHNIAAATRIKIYIWTLFASVGKLKISINYHNIIPTASRPIKPGYLETVGRCWRLLLPGTKTLPPHREGVGAAHSVTMLWWHLVAGGWCPSSISASCHHHTNHLLRARHIRAAARCWEQSPIICIFSHDFHTSHSPL